MLTFPTSAGALSVAVMLSSPHLVRADVVTVAASVSVTVNPSVVLNTGTRQGAKLGINTDYWWDNNKNRAAGATSLATSLQRMQLKFWRYPGGEKSDGYLWSTPPFTASRPRLARISTRDWPSKDSSYWTPAGSTGGTWAHPVLDFDQFMAACRAAKCTPDIVVAYDGAYKPAAPGGTSLTLQQAIDTARAWVTYANRTKGYGIRYWEIGNETWLPGYMGGDPGRAQQARDLVTIAAAMKSVDASIKVCTNANTQADFDTLLSIAHASIDCLVTHSYPAYGFASYADYLNVPALVPGEVGLAYNALQNYPNDRNRISIIESEYGGATFGATGTWRQNDLGHALMTAELTGRLVQDRRVKFSEYWTTRWIPKAVPGRYGELDALDAENHLLAQGRALSIFGNYTLSSMVWAAPQAGDLIVFASYGAATKRLNIFFINKKTSPQSTTVTVADDTGTATTGKVMALTGSSYATTSPVWASRPSVAVQVGAFAITLPATSLTVVSLR